MEEGTRRRKDDGTKGRRDKGTRGRLEEGTKEQGDERTMVRRDEGTKGPASDQANDERTNERSNNRMIELTTDTVAHQLTNCHYPIRTPSFYFHRLTMYKKIWVKMTNGRGR